MSAKTEFQKKLMSYVWGTRSHEGHWYLTSIAPRTVRPPGLGRIVTTKQAMFAAFEGDVPPGVELRPSCGSDKCVRPEHQAFKQCRGSAASEGLDLGYLEEDEVVQGPGKLPPGMTAELISRVKSMGKLGLTLDRIVEGARLSKSEIMKVRGGVYDRALAAARSGGEAAAVRIKASPVRKVAEVASEDGILNSEEVAWLRSTR